MNNIMVVDDVLFNRKLIIAILKKTVSNLKIFEAEGGRKALEILYKNDIDLIILDLMMPEMDGFEFLEIIKKDGKYNLIPIIINSAMNETDSIKKALSLGAHDFFEKPLKTEEIDFILPLKVNNALKVYEQTKEIMTFNEKINRELHLASFFQKNIINNQKKLKNVNFKGLYIPSFELGGDFYDCIEINEATWFIIADVSGHGITASIISSMIKVLFANYAEENKKPSEVLKKMNDFMESNFNSSEMFSFTAFIGKIEKNQLTFSNAGHPFPILYRREQNEFEVLTKKGFLAGILKDVFFEDTNIMFNKNDMIFMYTDGFFDNFEIFSNSLKCNLEIFLNHAKILFENFKNENELIENINKYILENFSKNKIKDKIIKDDISIIIIKNCFEEAEQN